MIWQFPKVSGRRPNRSDCVPRPIDSNSDSSRYLQRKDGKLKMRVREWRLSIWSHLTFWLIYHESVLTKAKGKTFVNSLSTARSKHTFWQAFLMAYIFYSFFLWNTTSPHFTILLKKTYYTGIFLTNDIITSLGSIIRNYLKYKESLVKKCLIY